MFCKLVIIMGICMLCANHFDCLLPNQSNGIDVFQILNAVTESVNHLDPNIEEDAKLKTPELIKKYGYMAEVHHVITEDGYILELHRITGGPKSPPKFGKNILLLQHGLLDSSATWILTGPNHGLAYLLADRNYDVWLGNSRGNTYSCNHTKFNPFGSTDDRRQFWSFSWHEIGIYDLPATIDYILQQTAVSKLQYIGHSQGNTAFLVMMSQKPEYNDKIIKLHAMAPAAFLSHVKSPPIRILSPFASVFDEVMSKWLGINDFMPSSDLIKLFGKYMCQDKAVTHAICENIIFLLAGKISDQLNATLLPVIVGHTPAGCSMKQLIHYAQEVDSGDFRQFDYGFVGNFRHYQRISPPNYNLSNVLVPVAIYYSKNDWLATVADVERLIRKLPNVIHTYLVPHIAFNHIDFVWGINATALLYDNIFMAMNSTTGKPITIITDNNFADNFL